MTMKLPFTPKQMLQLAVFFVFVFLATVAIATGIENGTFSGPSLADQIQNDGFGKIVEDRQSGQTPP